MDREIRSRSIVRAGFTRVYERIQEELKDKPVDVNAITVIFKQLEMKALELSVSDKAVYDLMLDQGDEVTKETIIKDQETADSYQDLYLQTQQIVNTLVVKNSSCEDHIYVNTVNKCIYKLPKIKWKRFGGQVLDWLSFWSQFKKVHEDETLQDEDKFQYLIQATVPGSKAREVVESYLPIGDNYQKAISSLKSRFGRDDILVEVYVRELLKLVLSNALNRKKVSLSTLYYRLETNLRALETLGVTDDKCYAMLFPLVELSLPPDLLRAWQRSSLWSKEDLEVSSSSTKSDSSENAKGRLPQLLSFLRREVEGEERIDIAMAGFRLKHSENGGTRAAKLKEVSSSKVVPTVSALVHSENAWKPAKLTRGQDVRSKDEREVNELYKKVRGILNKLTPQKFDTLIQQFQSLPINNLERMQGTAKLVFEKAVDDPVFSTSYANLCKVLARTQVVVNQGAQGNYSPSAPTPQQPPSYQNLPKNQQPVNFRKILITRCQQEFETVMKMDFEKRQLEINDCPDTEKRKELQLLFNEEVRKIRMKSLGLVRFIGELFKLKMLTASIMLRCIERFLDKTDEESLECLCKLLTTIGKEFEEQIMQRYTPGHLILEFNEYFIQMTKLSKKYEGSKVSNRVRFMLQDVIELRQNNWVPRGGENKRETMAQILDAVKRETEEAAILAAQSLHSISEHEPEHEHEHVLMEEDFSLFEVRMYYDFDYF